MGFAPAASPPLQIVDVWILVSKNLLAWCTQRENRALWLGVLGGHFSSNLEVLMAILAPSLGSWGPSWLQVGGLGSHLGSKLEVLGAILAPS